MGVRHEKIGQNPLHIGLFDSQTSQVRESVLILGILEHGSEGGRQVNGIDLMVRCDFVHDGGEIGDGDLSLNVQEGQHF
jgi:hypothetical protein